MLDASYKIMLANDFTGRVTSVRDVKLHMSLGRQRNRWECGKWCRICGQISEQFESYPTI